MGHCQSSAHSSWFTSKACSYQHMNLKFLIFSIHPQTLERRLVVTARHLTQKLKNTMATMSASSAMLPAMLRDPINEAKRMSENMHFLFVLTVCASNWTDVGDKLRLGIVLRACTVLQIFPHNLVSKFCLQIVCLKSWLFHAWNLSLINLQRLLTVV